MAGELRQQPQHLPPVQQAVMRVSCPRKHCALRWGLGAACPRAAGGAVCSERAVASPSPSSPHLHSGTPGRMRPFGTQSSLSCASNVPSLTGVPRLISPCSLWLLPHLPRCAGLGTERLPVTARSHSGAGGSKRRAGESRASVGPSSPQPPPSGAFLPGNPVALTAALVLPGCVLVSVGGRRGVWGQAQPR